MTGKSLIPRLARQTEKQHYRSPRCHRYQEVMSDQETKRVLYTRIASELAPRWSEVDRWIERDPQSWHEWCRLDDDLVAKKTDPDVGQRAYLMLIGELCKRFEEGVREVPES